MTKLNDRQGEILLKVARASIAQRLGRQYELPPNDEPALKEEGGTFVTLKQHGNLRGCIGNIEPAGSIYDSVRRNAASAAFNDHRFAPLTAEELDTVSLSVSVLTPASRLEYSGPEDLVQKLRPGIDGVILGYDGRSATFLPQVWEQLPTIEQFLDHLCLKAGLPKGFWLNETVSVYTYQVENFSEAKR